MTSSRSPKSFLLLLAVLAAAVSASASDAKTAPAAAAYPLKVCVVSGEELGGDMGDTVDYVYHQEGKPDRLVKLCCSKCVARFKKDPAKYLKKLDEAAAAAKSP